MSETALRFTGVVKNFGRAQALRGVTFDVAPGEFFGLVGVNGAGKTTLLNACSISAMYPAAPSRFSARLIT